MFFWLSKILWFLVHPLNLLFIGICVIAICFYFRWNRTARAISYAMAIVCIAITTLPIGISVVQELENRFPANPNLPAQIDGIVILGGVLDAKITRARGRLSINDAVERISEVRALLKHSPDARVVFSGGSGNPLDQENKEAHVAPGAFMLFSIDPARVLIEDKSRNTFENANFTFDIIKPKMEENWVLITSAFHMPRSVGAFRKAGWRVIPYPVDFMTAGDIVFRPSFNFRGGISAFSRALHECLGLLFYWLTDRSESLFPASGQ